MKVAFVCSGKEDGLKYLSENRDSIESILSSEWKVISTILQDLQTISLNFQDIGRKYANIEEFIFFYTGHADVKKKLKLRSHNHHKITIDDILEEIEILSPKKTAIILDACYSGEYKEVDLPDNFQLFCSSREYQVSYEFTDQNEPKNSVFSHYFCEAITKLNGKVTLDRIKEYVEKELKEYCKDKALKQEPIIISVNDSIVVRDKTLEEQQQKLQTPNQFIIDYLNQNNITIERVLKSVEKFVENKMLNALSKHKNISDLITHLSDDESFVCIIQDLFQGNDTKIEQWIKEHKRECKKVQSNIEPRVVIKFDSKKDGKKYDVSFLSNKFSHLNGSMSVNLEDEDSKNKLIKRMIECVRLSTPKVDMVLPIELMNEPIKDWSVLFNQSLAKLSQVNFRYIERYNSSKEIKEFYKEYWKNVQESVNEGHSLFPVSILEDLNEVDNHQKECGLASTFMLEKEHWEFLFQTKMSLVMLWCTKETVQDLTICYKHINQLHKNYYTKCASKPINLMYDNPNDYYYGKGQ